MMDKEKQKDFARRVSQANKTQLVAITYDIILENIKCAKEADSVDGFRAELKSAQKFLGELMRSLDFKYPISVNLLRIYEYVKVYFSRQFRKHCNSSPRDYRKDLM